MTDKLLQRPLVEVRRGFVLGYSPPAERSSVLALTVPSGKFVDLRVPQPGQEQTKQPVMPARYALRPGVYATAGTVTTSVPDATTVDQGCPEATSCLVHSVWKHVIDSAYTFGQQPTVDGADMLLLANGDVLEVGVFDRGDGSTPQLFKEFWINEDTAGMPWLVAEHHSSESRGMIVRIGPHCQGVLQTKDGFWLERWQQQQQQQTQDENNKTWKRDRCSGAGWLLGKEGNGPIAQDAIPVEWACAKRTADDTVEVDGRIWKITESWE